MSSTDLSVDNIVKGKNPESNVPRSNFKESDWLFHLLQLLGILLGFGYYYGVSYAPVSILWGSITLLQFIFTLVSYFLKPSWGLRFALLGLNNLGVFSIIMSSGLIHSPYLIWAFSLPVYAILLPLKRTTAFLLGGLSVLFALALVFLLNAKLGFFGLIAPESHFAFYQVSALSFVLLGAILVTLKENENLNKYSLSRRSNDKLSKDNKMLKRQVRDLSHRNHRLIMLYDNLKKFELANEQKTEILTEAARILDTKNKQIQAVRDEYKGQSSEIVELHEDLTNSIRYAQKIQEAITPDPEEVINHFRDAFILYKPKDIVSGDFYWFQEKKMVEGRIKILIAADCTGHGVPGAFMTVIGHSLINEIVNEMHIIQPDILLKELDRKLIEMLSNRKGQTEIHDGMDMVALVIDDYNGTVQYAAAHNPLYYVRNQELIRVKGSRYPVGSSQYRTEKVFDLHTIATQPGDVFYIFTDGFQDQFGQKAERKYMTRRFRGLLQSVNRLPLGKQYEKLISEFDSWKGDLPQTDDVLIIGFRV